MPRFVLLRHKCHPTDFKPSHWDLMLERQGILLTWELRELPTAWTEPSQLASSDSVAARQLADHRLAYLDYEGPVSEKRGSVFCHDRGTYELLQQSDGYLELSLQGAILHGTAELRQIKLHWQLAVKSP